MPSNARVDPLDHFESDVRITPEDREAQWAIRNERKLPTAEYLAWCSWITREPTQRPVERASVPFVLD